MQFMLQNNWKSQNLNFIHVLDENTGDTLGDNHEITFSVITNDKPVYSHATEISSRSS